MSRQTIKRKDWQITDGTWLASLLSQIQLRGMYGRITIFFEAGQIVRVVKEESLLPPQDKVPP